MENASKALIIAGAILISIVLITLGVVIIGQGQDVVNSSNIDEQVVSTWNQKFTQYQGESVSGSNVNALLNSVISSNTISARDGENNKLIVVNTSSKSKDNDIKVTNSGSPSRATQITKKAKPGVNYSVEIEYNTSGYVGTIKINAI